MQEERNYNFAVQPDVCQWIHPAQHQSWTVTNVYPITKECDYVGIEFGDNTLYFRDLFTRLMDNNLNGVQDGNDNAWFGREKSDFNWTIIDYNSVYCLLNTDTINGVTMYDSVEGPAFSTECMHAFRQMMQQLCFLISKGCPPDELQRLYDKQKDYLMRTTSRGILMSAFVTFIVQLYDDHLNGRSFEPDMARFKVHNGTTTLHMVEHANYVLHGVIPES